MDQTQRDPTTHPEGHPRHPATAAVLRHFRLDHLPPMGQGRGVSAECAVLAFSAANSLPEGPDLTDGLRELLRARDALVRAAGGA